MAIQVEVTAGNRQLVVHLLHGFALLTFELLLLLLERHPPVETVHFVVRNNIDAPEFAMSSPSAL